MRGRNVLCLYFDSNCCCLDIWRSFAFFGRFSRAMYLGNKHFRQSFRYTFERAKL